ncbi:hypothetical protein GQ42DRAFT_165136 [Ramicandelaber brevisporus]|nr:hypothetical protein GQ42DRAFT_165136 [Ramicandelaber brevisporus]
MLRSLIQPSLFNSVRAARLSTTAVACTGPPPSTPLSPEYYAQRSKQFILTPAEIEREFAALPSKVRELTAGYPVATTLAVHWGMQDSFGHLNNVAYLRFFETGRLQLMAALTHYMSPQEAVELIDATGVGVIAKDVYAKYLAPVHWPDSLTIATRAVDVKSRDGKSIAKDRMLVEGIAVSHKQEAIVASHFCTMVAFDYKKQSKSDYTESILNAVRTVHKSC